MIQVVLDLSQKQYHVAIVKLVIVTILTILLNILCSKGLSSISWIIVILPFLFTATLVGIVLFVFGYDVAVGKLHYGDGSKQINAIIPKPRPKPKEPHYLFFSKYYDTYFA
jgi:hypothetical protein